MEKKIAGGSEVRKEIERTLYSKSRISLKLSYFSQIDILDKEDIYYDIQYLSHSRFEREVALKKLSSLLVNTGSNDT